MALLALIFPAVVLLFVLSGIVGSAYLCAVASGRALACLFQVESDEATREVEEFLSPEHLAEIDALVASSQRMALDAQR